MKIFKFPSFFQTSALVATVFSSTVFYAETASAVVIIGLGNKCIDVAGGLVASGSPVVIFSCTNRVNQQWSHLSDGTIRGLQSGRCLTALNNGTANNTRIVISNCTGATSQKWSLNPNGSIVGVGSGKCLDIPTASTTNGIPLVLFTCQAASLNQIWSFLPLGL